MSSPSNALGPRAELKSLWQLALPLAMAQAGQSLMGMVDTAVVGRLSATAQGGAGLGNSLTFTIIFLGIGVMMGLDPLISQAIGARNEARARSLYWAGVWLALLTSVVLVVLMLFVPFVFEPFGVAPEVANGASEFLWWRLPGVPATLLSIVARSYLQGVGRARVMLWAVIVANVANFGLDVLLVFGAGPIPPLGIAGAALSTSVCSWLQFGLQSMWLGPSPSGVRRAFEAVSVKQATAVGVPIGLHLLAESGIFSLTGLFAARLGEVQAAAHQIALTWSSVTFSVAVGIGSAASVRVGWRIGARDTPAARQSGFVALVSGFAFMALSALTFVVFPRPLAQVMSTQPDVIAMASALFWVTGFFQISDGLQAIGAGILRGVGDTRFIFWVNIAGHWGVGLPVAYLLGVRGALGVVGLWWGLSAGLTTVAVCLVVRFAMLTRRHIEPLAGESTFTS